METGKVWLVGAGPSDAGLLTIKGKEALTQAEVVIYDRLVGDGVLLMIPENAEKIDVGKQSGNHTMCQEEINRLLLKKAQEGKRVVRLKGGDPFLFGRGGEELELLSENGISYEIVPGVPSAISVPAYNDIPVTHRDCASSLHIITGHKKKDEAYEIDFEALVRTKGTLVFLMGIAALPDICAGLLAAGMDPRTPAAILQQGTTANQKKILSTVSSLAEEARRQRAEPPGIIVVGQVCAYAQDFAWYEKLPLFGEKIVVTRPRASTSTLSGKLRGLGAEVLELPAIRTVAAAPTGEMAETLFHLADYDYLVFTSPAGVRHFFDALAGLHIDIRRFRSGKIAVIGRGTERELKQYGLIADLMPEKYDAKHLGALVGDDCSQGDRILIPRAREGSRELVEEIRGRRLVKITDLPLYDTVWETSELIDEITGFESGDFTMAVFTSASAVRGFAETTPGLNYSKVMAACIGVQTRAAAAQLGMRAFAAKEATIDSLTELVLQIHDERRRRPGADR